MDLAFHETANALRPGSSRIRASDAEAASSKLHGRHGYDPVWHIGNIHAPNLSHERGMCVGYRGDQ